MTLFRIALKLAFKSTCVFFIVASFVFILTAPSFLGVWMIQPSMRSTLVFYTLVFYVVSFVYHHNKLLKENKKGR